MKIIFFGTPKFAAYNLQSLIKDTHNVIAVVTGPDNKQGRGKKYKSSKVKEIAVENNITVLQPTQLENPLFIKQLKEYKADLFVVVAFKILPKNIWGMPKKGTINLHTSFLPNYRGAAPINRVLINGEKETGISTFFIDDKIDAGEIIMQKKIQLSNNITAGQLHEILKQEGSFLLNKTIDAIKENKLTPTIQPKDIKLKKAPKITKELQRIDWKQSAYTIHNLVRGLSPYIKKNILLKDVSICPSAWFIFKTSNKEKKRVKLQLTNVTESTKSNDFKIKTDNKSYLSIQIKNQELSILQLQLEGKRSVSIEEFLNGNQITLDSQIL